jgi:DNA-binding NarL/FixJ family response regulator
MFMAILESKVSDLARRASLSEREIAVFRGLVTGGHADEIATHLDISPRTVKYHQTKLLEKLGADSRHDLLRLIF